MSYFAFLDDAVRNCGRHYHRYLGSLHLGAEQLQQLDAVLQQGWQQGWHALLWTDYDFGLPLLQTDSHRSGKLSIHWFAECEHINDSAAWLTQQTDPADCAGISAPVGDTDKSAYLDTVAAIQAAIARGETYQINYTTRLHLDSYGPPQQLYRRLRQPVPYAALACLPDGGGETQWTLCFSPELFLNIAADGRITTEPMKGTAPILNDGLDEQRAQALQADPKNRAENVMIVDLLRNDLGKIATIGGVRVPEPFKVSPFGSVWQMTSAIEAQARAGIRAADIFQAAFPCGSITGAPKRMSMQLIEQLETSPRGLYTGSIGYLDAAPDSALGFQGVLNVVIRTLQLTPRSDGCYRGIYGVGSGIVADSRAEDEYSECGWKARFLTDLQPEFGIFETLLAEQQQCALLPKHLSRLQHSAAALNLKLPADTATRICNALAALPDNGSYRIKALLDSDGLHLSHAPCPPLLTPQYAVVTEHILPDRDYLRRFKTTRRQVYDEGWQQAEQQGAFDSLFFNRSGYLLEGGRSAVFVKIDGDWHTPAADLDILDSIMRREVLNNPQHYLGCCHISESRITRMQLQQAEAVVLCNALRGLIPVGLK